MILMKTIALSYWNRLTALVLVCLQMDLLSQIVSSSIVFHYLSNEQMSLHIKRFEAAMYLQCPVKMMKFQQRRRKEEEEEMILMKNPKNNKRKSRNSNHQQILRKSLNVYKKNLSIQKMMTLRASLKSYQLYSKINLMNSI